jgi:transposase-like protein
MVRKRKRLSKKQRFRLRAKKAAKSKRLKRELEQLNQVSKLFHEGKNVMQVASILGINLNEAKRLLKKVIKIELEFKKLEEIKEEKTEG